MYKYIVVTILFLSSLNCKAIEIKPDSVYHATPKEYNITFLEKNIYTIDSYKIKIWKYLPNKSIDKKTSIILSYGDAGNMSYYINYANQLCKRGYTVIAYDYRGFGESQPFNTLKNNLYYNEYVLDLKSIINYTREQNNNNIGLLGLSMGSIISILAIDTNINFFIGEGVLGNLISFTKTIKTKYNKELRLPENSELYYKKVKKLNIPMLIFAGNKDVNTPPKYAKELCNYNINRKIVLFNGKHLEGIKVLEGSYFDKIDSFILSINSK